MRVQNDSDGSNRIDTHHQQEVKAGQADNAAFSWDVFISGVPSEGAAYTRESSPLS